MLMHGSGAPPLSTRHRRSWLSIVSSTAPGLVWDMGVPNFGRGALLQQHAATKIILFQNTHFGRGCTITFYSVRRMNDPVIQKLWHEVYGCNERDPWIPVWAFIFRCHKPDLDVINRMLPPGDHAAFYQAYVQCHLFAEPHRRFTDYACSVYREFRRHAPARGGFVLAIGLLSRTRVDAAAVADAAAACPEMPFLAALAHARTRTQFEHVLIQHSGAYASCKERYDARGWVEALVHYRFDELDSSKIAQPGMFTFLITVRRTAEHRNSWTTHPIHGGAFTIPAGHAEELSAVAWNDVLEHGRLPEGWRLITEGSTIGDVVRNMRRAHDANQLRSIRVDIEPGAPNSHVWVSYAKHG